MGCDRFDEIGHRWSRLWFDTVTADPTALGLGAPLHENANAGVTNLVVRLPGMTTSARIVVRISGSDDTSADPLIEPLSDWVAAGPVAP
jgi:hypothetical protein